MATVYKETFTRPLPKDAELFTRKGEQFAKWKDASGKTRQAKVTTGKDGSPRLLIEAGTYTAKYRDGSGIVRKVTTGCRDETAARQVLAQLVKRSEHVKAGITTSAQDAVIDQQATAIGEHIDAYLIHLATKTCDLHRHNVGVALRKIVNECEFIRLAHIDRGAMELWMTRNQAEGMGARTRNTHRAAIIAFANWCVSTRRLAVNPLAGLPKADEKADERRHRRALTEDELVKLLDVAQRRPLLEVMMIRRGKHKGETAAKVKPETVARLERLGRERALIYKTLVLTGLRKGELASLTIGQLVLDGPTPYALLHAADEKNRQGSKILLRADLAADIGVWLADKLAVAQADAMRRGQAVPSALPSDMPLFTVPEMLVKILDRDLVAAGIAKRDGRGWTVDVHALRHSFGTLLSKGGVMPRTAQAAMRHSRLDLTMNTYTDPRLLDVAGALNSLPTLPLDGKPQAQDQRATGTYDGRAIDQNTNTPLVPTLVPTSDFSGTLVAIAGKIDHMGKWATGRQNASKPLVNRPFCQPRTTTDTQRATRLERATVSLEGCDNAVVSAVEQGLTTGDNAACTNACTSQAKNAHETPIDANSTATPLETLANAIANLSADDRTRLAAMLTQDNGNKGGNQ